MFVIPASYCFALQYEIIDLGTVYHTSAAAYDINNNGEIVGSGMGHALYWKDGVMTDLLNVVSQRNTTYGVSNNLPTDALAINNSGKIVGAAGGSPFLYDINGVPGNIRTLPMFDINISGSARDINDSGYIVGETITSSRSSGDARLWNPNDYYGQSHTLGYGIGATAVSINSSGQILTNYNGGVYIDGMLISGLAGGKTINDIGVVVGSGGIYGSALWSDNGGVVSLNPLVGGNRCEVNDININNLAVGRSHTKITDSNALDHAILWEGNDVIDLGTLQGGSWSAAYAINDNGWIVGQSGDANNEIHATLWKPLAPQAVPEPSTFVAACIMFIPIGLSKLRLRRK